MADKTADFGFEVTGQEDADLNVIRFSGEEGLSRLYEFEIDLASENSDLDFEAIIGSPAKLVLNLPDGVRHVHGIVSRFEEVRRGKDLYYYQAGLVPKAWMLTMGRDSRIFQGESTPDIIKAVLSDAGLKKGTDFDFKLSASYAPRNYCVQYRESDFDFITRLAEEEGILYYFESDDAGQKLVLSDNPGGLGPLPWGDAEVLYKEGSLGGGGEEVSTFQFRRSLRIGKITLRDYDFKQPKLSLEAAKESGLKKENPLEFYDYPGEFPSPSLGKTLAGIRLEQARAEARLAEGGTICRRFTPGYRFTLAEHPRHEGDYLIVRVSHHGEQMSQAGQDAGGGGGERPYFAGFECVPADVAWRPPRLTPRPVVEGVQTAVVTGPSGEEIHCDEHGRVKVQFPWDREGQLDDKTSCWIRCCQPWGGGGYGGIFIPRIGQEVIVEFIEGDPDRPLITGRVYNGLNPPPYGLPDSKTMSTFRTNSSPGGGGFNELRMEDKAGSEEIFLHGQKDWNTLILNDRTTEIGHDQKAAIKNDKSIEVGGNHTEKIDGDMKLTVGGNETEEIGGNRSIEVGGNHQERIKGALGITVGDTGSISIGGAGSVSIQGKGTVNVGGDLQESSGGKMSVSSADNYSLSAGGNGTLSTAKKLTVDVGDAMGLSVAKDCIQSIGKKLKVTVKDEHGLEAKKITLEAKDEIVLKTGSASIALKKNGDITIQGGKINIKGSGDVILKGSKITQN